MWGAIHLTVLLLTISLSGISQENELSGVPFITKYNSEDYEYHGQTWAVTHSPQGDFIIAHDKGVLIFDGHNWELLELPNKSTAFSLKVFDDKVFVGGYHEMGYLDTDQKGAYEYHSLMPENTQQQTVWDIAYHDSVVYYRSSKGIVMYDFVTKQNLIKEDDRYSRFLLMNGKWYVMFYTDGIYELTPELFTNPSKEPFHSLDNHMFYFALPYEGSVMLVYDFQRGLMLYNLSNRQLTRWPNELKEKLGTPYVYAAKKLSNHQYVLSVPRKGLYLLDRNGQITDVFNRANAFTDNYIINIYEDKRGNLWLNTNNNVLFMEYNSPFRKIDKEYHLPGYFDFSHIHNDSLFVGTTSGLYAIAMSDINKPKARFEPVIKDIMFLNHYPHENGFFATTSDSLIFYPSNRAILPFGVNHFSTFARDTSKVLAGSEQGIYILSKKDGPWTGSHLKGFSGDVSSLVSTETDNIWIQRSFKGIWNLKLSADGDSVISKVELTSFEEFSENEDHALFEIDGKPVISSTKGLIVWNRNSQRFEPMGVYNAYLPKRMMDIMVKGAQNELWFWDNDKESFGGVFQRVDEGVVFDTTRFKRLEGELVSDIDFYDNKMLFTASDKLVFYNSKEDILKENLKVSVSSIYDFQADTLIKRNPEKCSKEPLTLSPQRNNLRFHGHSDLFIRVDNSKYSFFLEGYNDEWSPWQKASYKEYSDIPPGDYVVYIKVKDHHGHIATSKGVHITILTPWYQTATAIAFYVFFVLFLIFYIFERVKRHNRKEQVKLEEKIKIRTKELIKEKDALRKERDKVDEMNATKDKFFSIIAHDLRSPFNSLLGLTDVLKQDFDYLDDDEKKEIVDNLNKTANQSFSLLDNLLIWSRSQRNSVEIYPGFYDLTTVVNETLGLLDSTIRSKKITLHNNLKDECIGYFDKNMVLTIVRNLVSNAIKFTDEQGIIELSAAEDDHFIHLHVKDNGIGISDVDLESLFDTGKQTRRKEHTTKPAQAWGLSFVKTLPSIIMAASW